MKNIFMLFLITTGSLAMNDVPLLQRALEYGRVAINRTSTATPYEMGEKVFVMIDGQEKSGNIVSIIESCVKVVYGVTFDDTTKCHMCTSDRLRKCDESERTAEAS